VARVKKRCEIKGGGQEMVVMVLQWQISNNNLGEFGAES